ncbi:MAG: hypothetical protein ABR559_01325 [Gemmatimonadota bacterium]
MISRSDAAACGPGRNRWRRAVSLAGQLGLVLAGGMLAPDPLAAQDVADPAPGSTQSVLIPSLLAPDFLLSVGRIVDPDGFDDQAVILGTTRELAIRELSLTPPDLVFVPRVLAGRPLEPGERIQFFELTRPVDDEESGARIGTLLVPTGIGRVDSLPGEVARVRITHAFLPILLGHRARLVTEADTLAAGWHESGVEGVAATGHVLTFQDEKAIYPPFDKLFLWQHPWGGAATPDGLAPGDLVQLFRPGPVERGFQLPDILIGEAMVVRLDGRIAAAVITQVSRSDLGIGDLYRRIHRDP